MPGQKYSGRQFFYDGTAGYFQITAGDRAISSRAALQVVPGEV